MLFEAVHLFDPSRALIARPEWAARANKGLSAWIATGRAWVVQLVHGGATSLNALFRRLWQWTGVQAACVWRSKGHVLDLT